jgi:hypothetical protein
MFRPVVAALNAGRCYLWRMNLLRFLTAGLLLTTVIGAGLAAPQRPKVTIQQGKTAVTPTADFQVVKLRRGPFH